MYVIPVVRLRKEDQDFSWTPYLRKQNRIFFSEFGMTIENYVMNIYHHVSALKSQCNICLHILIYVKCVFPLVCWYLLDWFYMVMCNSVSEICNVLKNYWFCCILKLKNLLLSEISYVLSNFCACCYLNFWLDKEQLFLFLWVVE